MSDTTKLVDLARRFVAAINAQDEHGMRELMTDDFVFTDYVGAAAAGGDRLRDGFREYFDAYPEYLIHVDEVLVSGAEDVLVIGKVTGSHIPVEVEARTTLGWTATVRDGKVSEWRIYAEPEVIEAQGGRSRSD